MKTVTLKGSGINTCFSERSFIHLDIVFAVTPLGGLKKLISNLVSFFLISFVAFQYVCNTSTGHIFVSAR